MNLDNQTPFAAAWLLVLDKQAAEHLVLVIKATYSISEDGKLELAKKQESIRPVDQFQGEPGQSSIRYEGELGPVKLATDVVLVGSAVATRPGTTEMEVSFRVGPLLKRVIVFGDRRWKKSLLGLAASKPEPFERIPLIYENAYGGRDSSAKNPKHHAQEARNPVGRGFCSKKSELDFADTLLPNIEDPDHLLRRPGQELTPQGFGFIGRDWEPRVRYVGTYDQKWTEERLPLLPLDFDERYHNAATPELTAQGYLKGAEVVELLGCTRSGRLSFGLPAMNPIARALVEGTQLPISLNLNTVLVDSDARQLLLLWRGSIKIHGKLPQLDSIECALPRR